MARWYLIAFGLIAFVFLAGLRVASSPAQPGAAAKAPALSGKPIFLQAKDHVALTLEKVEIRQLGGRAFVVGQEMKKSPYQITKEMFGGATVWVPVDAVTQLVELEPVTREK
jgi:hypothetical protein